MTVLGPALGGAATEQDREPADGTAEPLRTRWRRRWRWPVVVGGIVLLSGVLAAVALPRGTAEYLDPRNPTPNGSRAVAQILRDQGVDVRRVTRTAEMAAAARAGSTLLVTDPQLLNGYQLGQVRASAADLVLVRPEQAALDRLAPPVRVAERTRTAVAEPACVDPDAVAAGSAIAGEQLYRVASGTAAAGLRVCYPVGGGSGSVVVGSLGLHRVAVLGQPRVLTNQVLADDGNAALALRLLGHRPTLVWYLPDPLETATAGGGTSGPSRSLADLAPPWLGWVAVQLLLAIGVAMLWRARRLGRLVQEPLPVVVRAAETQEGRARLYRQSHARARAAATLRTAAARRIAARLAAPPGTRPEQLVTLLAALTGRTAADLHDVLLGPAPRDETALVALADQLDDLETRLAAARTPTGRTAPE